MMMPEMESTSIHFMEKNVFESSVICPDDINSESAQSDLSVSTGNSDSERPEKMIGNQSCQKHSDEEDEEKSRESSHSSSTSVEEDDPKKTEEMIKKEKDLSNLEEKNVEKKISNLKRLKRRRLHATVITNVSVMEREVKVKTSRVSNTLHFKTDTILNLLHNVLPTRKGNLIISI